MMEDKRHIRRLLARSLLWLIGAVFCLVTLIGAPIVGAWIPYDLGWHRKADVVTRETLTELDQLGILRTAPRGSVRALINFRRSSGKSVAQILRVPTWARRLGLQSESFKATWYISNPFELLPPDLQIAIRKNKIPFKSRMHVWQWCRIHHVPKKWRQALYAALVETTPQNLWRASRGLRSITKSGEFLEPIVVDLGNGHYQIQSGHIATDPRVIPTNSEVLLLIRIRGVDRLIKVKATDVGAAIKGKHVDLPIHAGPETMTFPNVRLPKEHIRNNFVRIMTPLS